MNCTHCGTLLPPGALFCGECGRSVNASNRSSSQKAGLLPSPVVSSAGAKVLTPARWVEDPVTGESLVDEVDEIADVDVEVGTGETRCDQCGTVMAHDDIFCPECGFVSRSITRAFSTSDFTDETRQLDFAPGSVLIDKLPERSTPEPEPELELEPEPESEQEPEPEPAAPAEPEQTRTPHLSSGSAWLAPPPAAPPTPATPAAAASRAPRTAPAPPARPVHSFLDDDEEDLEATRIVNRISGNRFVLQFSTGESFTVHGSGLVGRNPQPEPGEFFDHLVRVLDTGKSVSKSHLEFGQEQGAFWVKDRYSGNGTVIREPDISARRAEADRRYRVVRGTRIDIGEQFFVIS